MATNDQTKELDALAFDLYSKKRAAPNARPGSERDAAEAYKDADAFLAFKKKMASGELVKADENDGRPKLQEWCCPNLPATNPHNMVARLHVDRAGRETPGDVNKINKVLTWLDKNPETPSTDINEHVNRFGREFPQLGWELPEIHVARILFAPFANA